MLPGIVSIPLTYLFFECYFGGGGGFFLFLGILGVLFYVIMVFICLKVGKEQSQNSSESVDNIDTGLSPSTKFTAILFGLFILGRHSKEKSIFDSSRDDLFWQEKYHKHDSFCDDDDY